MSNSTKQTQPQSPAPGWFRRCLRFFLRSVRLLLILLVLCLFAGFWYVHEVGLPESVTQRVIAQFKAKGWNVSIGRLRWRGFGLVVADNIQLAKNEPNSPQLFIQEASCDFHLAGSLKNPRLELESIAVDGGYVNWSLPGTNRHSPILVCRELKGLVRARGDDAWDLSYLDFSALPVWPSGPGGIKINLRGNLLHASKLSQWKIGESAKTPSEKPPLDWARIFNGIHAFQFAAPPELMVRLQLDAADLTTSKAEVKFTAAGIGSPWGSGTNLMLTLDLQPAGSWQTNLVLREALLQTSLHLEAENAATPWGKAKELRVDLNSEPTLAGTLGTNTQVKVEAVEPVTPTEKAKSLAATVQIAPDSTGSNTYQFQITASANAADTRFGQAQEFALEATPLVHFSTNLSLQDISGPAQIKLKQVQSPFAEASQATLLTAWRWPELQISADARMYNGALMAKTAYNATNRELHFNLSSDIDVQPELVRLLRSQSNSAVTNAIQWIGYYTNLVPPNLELEGRLVLPPSAIAGAPSTNWFAEALPSLSAAGRVKVGAGAFHGAFFLNAETSFTLTNMLLTLPHLKIGREEGMLEVEYQSDLRSGEFHSRIASQIYPNVAQAFFDHPEIRQAFDEVVFTEPPVLQGAMQGSWRDLRRLNFQGAVSGTNFTIHGENVKFAQSQLQFTNLVLRIVEPFAQRVEGSGRADLVAIDISEGLLYLTNGQSRLDPYAITRIVGKEATKAIAPYQFASTPEGEVNGVVDLRRHSDRNDLHFKVKGGPFHWGKFELQKVAGQVDWVGKTLSLTNVQGDLKTGRIDGHAYFDFEPEQGPAFACKVNLIDVDLHEFLAAWSPKTNHIEGIFNAELKITQANAAVANTWQGYGWVSLRNGLLWDIPMFGLFSPVLNTFAPGLGNSRASEGSATYRIIDGIISTSDLEIHATAMRMKIQGTVDFDSEVNVRAEAELLRDVPVIGLPMSKILWPFTKLFEYKVTGSLDNPKAEPVYILPRVLLHPIKSLKEFVGDEKKE